MLILGHAHCKQDAFQQLRTDWRYTCRYSRGYLKDERFQGLDLLSAATECESDHKSTALVIKTYPLQSIGNLLRRHQDECKAD